ncbi:Rieske (2Fe-2S) protein [Hydrogenophaga sp. OTU3427]|uniref:Rieske (2Fe-2S) protein n=1 Tax=Hydrogenophaga sp. OTU3427 TaxID=3043856 RepID=UPI00313D9DEE
MSAQHLCDFDDLPDGKSRGFDTDGRGQDTVLLVRRGERVYAYRDACPHLGGTPMAWRKDAYLSGDGQHIVCHAHGARFDIVTGACVLGPCLGQALEPVSVSVLEQATQRLVVLHEDVGMGKAEKNG